MGGRFDYYDDPTAPSPNSVKPSASAFVLLDGKVLMTQRVDNGNWTIPSGAHNLGESLSMTAVRETLEETGINIRPVGVVGIFTDPRHVTHYTSNNEVRQEFSVVYRAEYVSGQPRCSSETSRVEWVPVSRVNDLQMDRSQRERIAWALTHEGTRIDPMGV